MSNNHNQKFQRPLSLPGTVPPPPAPAALPAEFAELLEKFPLPWCVGPYGDIWVASDVEQYDPEKTAHVEKIAGPNGTWWRTSPTCPVAKPRMVMEDPADKGVAAFLIWAANKMASKR